MKKYMVEVFVKTTNENSECHEVYECESYERAKNWAGECIRLEDVNTYKTTKTGKVQRKQLSRGKYIVIEKLSHWIEYHIYVWENGTDNVIEKFEG